MQLTLIGAALMALVLLAALKPEVLKYAFGDMRPNVLSWRDFVGGLCFSDRGVVVVTYSSPGIGTPSTTAPTASQAANIPEMAATVFFADTDTAAVITHNWGLPNSFPNWLWPQVFFNKSLGGASDSSFATNFTFGLTNTNSVTMTKISVGTGSGGTYNVYLRRPHSIGL